MDIGNIIILICMTTLPGVCCATASLRLMKSVVFLLIDSGDGSSSPLLVGAGVGPGPGPGPGPGVLDSPANKYKYSFFNYVKI